MSVALAAAACGGPPASVALPAKATPATVAPAALKSPAHASPQQVVATAYRGYWQAYAAAMSASSAARARALLAPYAAPSDLPRLLASLRRVWAAHQAAYGGAVTHVKKVQVSGHRALLNDCLDLSHFGAVSRATNQVVPGSFGRPDQDFWISLRLSGGRWRVSNMQPVEVACS